MQAEPIGGAMGLARGVEFVAEDRMPKLLEVDAKLMAAAGDRRQFEEGAVRVGEAGEDAPMGRRRAPFGVVDDLEGRAHRRLAKRQVDGAAIGSRVAPSEGEILLRRLAGLELPGELAVDIGVEGEQDHPRGVPIEAMHDAGPGAMGCGPGGEAVLLLGADAGHGEHAGGLVEGDEPSVLEEDRRKRQVGGLSALGRQRETDSEGRAGSGVDYQPARSGPLLLAGYPSPDRLVHGRSPTMLSLASAIVVAIPLLAAHAAQQARPAAGEQGRPVAAEGGNPAPLDWKTLEEGILANHVQLTFPERFVKAGEAYFSPDDKRIIFQAVELPAAGKEPDPFYAMFVADVVRSDAGAITGIANIRRVSPPGSANTCGWFDPTDPMTILFASTIGAPSEGEAPGYQRGTGRYKWMFPPEMRIVLGDLKKIDAGAPWDEALQTLVGDGKAYAAEGAFSPDGKWLIYSDLATGQGDLWVMNRQNGERTRIVAAPGYDGGPFFSPDGKRICYRSDRTGTNLLQIYVADLAFDARGHITGIAAEHQVTRNAHVNWAPFFHPSGQFVVFASSAIGHMNYEVFAVDAGVVDRDGVPQVRYGTNLRRVTHADGADVLPVFSHDGKSMMWTGQRGTDASSQIFVAEWTLPADPKPAAGGRPTGSSGGASR